MPPRKTSHPRPTALAVAIYEKRGAQTQTEAAEAIGINQGTLSSLERGKPPALDTALKLARWLGWSVERVAEEAGKAAGGAS
jgi:DNA-binding XRE family transcriptional regulator